MKIISAKEMALIESEAFNDGASDEAFMNQAAAGIAKIIWEDIESTSMENRVTLICGKGNNGGDAYLTGQILMERGYKVEALRLGAPSILSPLCKLKHDLFLKAGGQVTAINVEGDLPIPGSGVYIDGMFGTGFKGEVYGIYAAAIAMANQSGLPIYSIDIPSGINGTTSEVGGLAIRATHTIFLGLPKTGFFLGDAWAYVGKLHGVDFGLNKKYLNKATEDFKLINKKDALRCLPKIMRNRHKYEAGYVVGLAGSPGMPGAAMLSSLSSLRIGAGIMRLLHPKGMEAELAHSPYEVIKQAYTNDDPDLLLATLNCATAIFIGPGIGNSAKTQELLSIILPRLEKPCVLDADALNILAQSEINLPGNVVMTPHIGEMHRLLHLKKKSPLNHDFIKRCADFAAHYKITLLVKGSPTFLFHEGRTTGVNPYGDPGMATAGTGDVLTGIIAALLAQNMLIYDAAYLGTYLHSRAGELAAQQHSSYGMIASDLLEALPFVLKTMT